MIKWRDNKKFKPSIILSKLGTESYVEHGKVSFDGFSSFVFEAILYPMIEFTEDITMEDKTLLIHKSMISSARQGDFTPEYFINQMNLHYRSQKATKEKTYFFLSSISLGHQFSEKALLLNDCIIRFHKDKYPRKLATKRIAAIDSLKLKVPNDRYFKISIECKAKSSTQAHKDCIQTMNIFRAVCCLTLNDALSVSLGTKKPKPINKIGLGEYFTVHEDSSESDSNFPIWYDSSFHKKDLTQLSPQKLKIFTYNVRYYLTQLEKHKAKKQLFEVLLRYVDAFDSVDSNNSIVKGWATLESLLVLDKEKNSDAIPKRASFVHLESAYHRQILESIREYRNKHVHYGEVSTGSSTIAYLLHSYLTRVLRYHISQKFKSIGEINTFLNHNDDVPKLQAQLKELKAAISYRSPPSKKRGNT